MHCDHRRRIKTEAKAKVVASVWGAEFIQFLAAPAVFPRTILIMNELQQDDLKEKDKFIQFFKIVLGEIASVARNLINSPNRNDDLCLCVRIYPSSMIATFNGWNPTF